MGADCDHLLAVPSRDTARIQECHEFVYHVVAGTVETKLTGTRPAVLTVVSARTPRRR